MGRVQVFLHFAPICDGLDADRASVGAVCADSKSIQAGFATMSQVATMSGTVETNPHASQRRDRMR